MPLAAVPPVPHPLPSLSTLPCLQDLLTRHKAMVAVYLSEHYCSFFQDYSKLLQSSNYVTRRQSLKVILLHMSFTNCGCHLLTTINSCAVGSQYVSAGSVSCTCMAVELAVYERPCTAANLTETHAMARRAAVWIAPVLHDHACP